MKRLRITSILISLLMLCSCSAGTEQPAPGTSEAAESSETAEATQPAEASAEAPYAKPVSQPAPEPERDFTEFFAPPDTSAHADYGERYCDWKYDASMLIGTEEEFLRRGGSESWLNAGRSAVRGTEEFRAVETQSAEMWLYTDGNYYYKKQSGDEEIVTSRFSLSNGYFDEDVKPLVLFDSAAVGDFDGDGATEAFIMFEFPSFSWPNYTENAAVFVNSAGQAEVVSTGVGGYLAPMRYRDFVHMGVGFGVNNLTQHSEIFAVENGKAVQKHSAFSLGSKYGLCMLESAAQVPGSWLVIWDNIEKQYRELAHEPAPEGLAAAIYSSPLSEQLEDMTELKDSIAVIGGKYVCIGTAWNSVTLEHDNGRLTVADEHLISSASETEPDYSVYLPAAEELAVPAPIPADRAEYVEYTLTGDGKREAFVVFRLPYTVSYDIYGESGGISVAVYAASDGTSRALPDWELVSSWGGSPEFTLIQYENEVHLYNADNSAIMGLRGGVPKRLATCDPDGDGRYFGGTMFYHPALGEYCYEKLQPMSGELLAQLIESPAYQEYLSLHPDNVPEYAWINAGGYIITDHYGEYRWDGESFTKTTGARGGGWWIARRINGTYLCFE